MSVPGGFSMPQATEAPVVTETPVMMEEPVATEAPAETKAAALGKTGSSRSFDKMDRGQLSGSFGTASSAANTQEQGILMAACVGVLLVALVIAFVFKRNA